MPAEHTLTETTHEGYTVRIVPDEDPMDPREWDNLGRMFCFHTRYDLGDPHDYLSVAGAHTATELRERIATEHEARVVMSLNLLDHSGLSMRTGEVPFHEDPQGWDVSMVGWIMDTAATRELMGMKDASDQDIREALEGEVRAYSRHLEGGYVGYLVEDPDTGEVLDSCFGYYDESDALNDAYANIKVLQRKAEEDKIAKTVRIEDSRLVCPHCGERDSITEVGKVFETHYLELREEGGEEDRPLLVTGPGQICWETYDFSNYECRFCVTEVLIPEEWDREDES